MAGDTEAIENKIAQSGLVSIDLKEYHTAGEREVIDLKYHLFEGLILKEKDFRDFLKKEDWGKYSGKLVAITSTADAIIPAWAYMLLTAALQPFARKVVCGSLQRLEEVLFHDSIAAGLHPEQYKDKRVMIKGCGDVEIPLSAFSEATALLLPYARSVLYGEACSNVPIYKKGAD